MAIEGDSTATAFKLTSRLITNTLTQLDTSGSTLNVGVDYNGAAVEKTGDTVMIDTANGVLGGNLSPLSNGYNASNRTTAQDGFTFSIISGTTNGTTAVTDYSTLPEGIWSGDVSVQFDATDQLISLMYQQGYPLLYSGRNCYEKAPSASRSAVFRNITGPGAGCRRYIIVYEQ